MDVVKNKSKQNSLAKHKVSITLLVVFVVMSFIALQSSGSASVSRQDILIEKVLQGDLDVVVEGYGKLISNKQRLITAMTGATVKQILLKPGANVTADSIIVRLENPELLLQVENSQQELAQIKANLRQLKLTHQTERLIESAKLAELTAQLETASLKRKAEEKLIKQNIVSQLSFQGSVVNERQLSKRIDILKQLMTQLELVQKEALNIMQERVKQRRGQLHIAQSRLDKLVVTAGIDGVLQRLSVELGQSLTAGQEVALIGSVTDLIALVKVPQIQAQQVVVGQKAVIDTRREKIDGVVTRIDPVVENNSVNIEVSLPQNLPVGTRPQLSIDAMIIAETLTNIKYIKRPANLRSNSQSSLYRVDKSIQNAKLESLKFGRKAGRYIEVVTGAKMGESFIVSDLSQLKSASSTLIITP